MMLLSARGTAARNPENDIGTFAPYKTRQYPDCRAGRSAGLPASERRETPRFAGAFAPYKNTNSASDLL
jgi:hypothetical protein